MDQSTIKTVLLCLEEEREIELVTKQLEASGAPVPIIRTTGEKTWQEILQRKVDLLIIGWRLPELSGLAILNRFKQLQDNLFTPVMIISQWLAPEEFSLLQELPCIKQTKKSPLTKASFDETYKALITDANWYQQNAALIENLIDFAETNGSKALELFRTPLTKAPNPVPLALLMAKKLREKNLLDEAINLANEVLKRDPNSAAALSELGKIHFLKNNHSESARLLEKAQALSPKNVARLCMLGEIDLVQDRKSEALNRFATALAIDPKDATSASAVQLIQIDQTNSLVPGQSYSSESARTRSTSDVRRLGGAPVAQSLASMLNMNAIGLVRTGQFATGIEIYSAALNLLSDNTVRAKVIYNIGMAYLRWNKLEKALDWFNQSAMIEDTNFDKAIRYVSLIEERIANVSGSKAPSPTAPPPAPPITVIDEFEEESFFGR